MPGLPLSSMECALLPQPSRLFVEVTSRCNLRCPMCVKHSGQEKSPEGDMMSVIALSLPEMVILRKVLKPRLIFVFAGVVGLGILIVGYLFNAVI